MIRSAAVVLVAVGVVLGASGCGIPTDSEPRVIADETAPTTAPTASAGEGPNPATVFLTQTSSDKLQTSDRSLDAEPTAATVLESLFSPPTEQERDLGLGSVIPQDTTLLSTDQVGPLLTIDLSDNWTSLQGPEQLPGYAQVVLTVTQIDEVKRVRFSVEGELVEAVPTPDGAKTEVTAEDYRDFGGKR